MSREAAVARAVRGVGASRLGSVLWGRALRAMARPARFEGARGLHGLAAASPVGRSGHGRREPGPRRRRPGRVRAPLAAGLPAQPRRPARRHRPGPGAGAGGVAWLMGSHVADAVQAGVGLSRQIGPGPDERRAIRTRPGRARARAAAGGRAARGRRAVARVRARVAGRRRGRTHQRRLLESWIALDPALGPHRDELAPSCRAASGPPQVGEVAVFLTHRDVGGALSRGGALLSLELVDPIAGAAAGASRGAGARAAPGGRPRWATETGWPRSTCGSTGAGVPAVRVRFLGLLAPAAR